MFSGFCFVAALHFDMTALHFPHILWLQCGLFCLIDRSLYLVKKVNKWTSSHASFKSYKKAFYP